LWGNKELREKGEKDELNYLYNIEDIGVFSGKERQTYDKEKKMEAKYTYYSKGGTKVLHTRHTSETAEPS